MDDRNASRCIRSPLHLLLLLSLPLAISAAAHGSGREFLKRNPNAYVADVARSVWNSGSLVSQRAEDLYDRLQRLSEENPGHLYTQDVFSIGEGGEPLPTRATYLSVLAAPFVGIAGESGLWILSQGILFAILLAWAEMNCRWIDRRAAVFLALGFLMTTALVRYTFSFSYDTFALALLLGGVVTQRKNQALGAFLIALTVETRPLFALFLPLAFLEFADAPSRRRLLQGTLGVGLGLGLVALTNSWLWGSPTTFSYHRLGAFQAGEVVIVPPAADFSVGELVSQLPRKLFMGQESLFIANPLLLIALPAGFVAARYSRGMALLLVTCLVYLGFLLALASWDLFGNLVRYALPATALLSLSVAFVAGRYRPPDSRVR